MVQKDKRIKFDINYISLSNPFIAIHITNNNSVTQKNENPSNILLLNAQFSIKP